MKNVLRPQGQIRMTIYKNLHNNKFSTKKKNHEVYSSVLGNITVNLVTF